MYLELDSSFPSDESILIYIEIYITIIESISNCVNELAHRETGIVHTRTELSVAITVGAEAITAGVAYCIGAVSKEPEYLVYYSLCVLEESIERQNIEDSYLYHIY